MYNFATSLAISILKISKDRRMSITDVIVNAIDCINLATGII